MVRYGTAPLSVKGEGLTPVDGPCRLLRLALKKQKSCSPSSVVCWVRWPGPAGWPGAFFSRGGR